MFKQPKWLNIFNSVSTTNLRIFVTMIMVILTGIAHLYANRTLDANWLLFLGAIAGVDTMQFTAKRVTHRGNGTTDTQEESEDNESQESSASTDIRELAQTNQPG